MSTPGSPAPAPPAPNDAAGGLLRDIVIEVVEPAYRSSRPRRPRHGTRALMLVVLVTVVAALAGAALAQLRASPGGGRNGDLLQEEVLARTENADTLATENVELRTRIEEVEAGLLAERDSGLTTEVQQLGIAVGAVPVSGPGVRVTVDDATGDGDLSGDEEDLQRVLDVDLQILTNGLWANGAEAVAVNGQRLTTLSAIRSVGYSITVGYRPLARPYTVEAIGDPERLADEVTGGDTARYLASLRNDYGIQVSVAAEGQLQLPGSSSLLIDQASPVPAPSVSLSEPSGVPS